MTTVPRAHDLLCNTDMGDFEPPDWMVRVKEDYFKKGAGRFPSRELNEMLDEMDATATKRAVLMMNMNNPSERVRSFVDARPDRFSVGLGGHDLLQPDAEPAPARELRRRLAGHVHVRRPVVLGRRAVPAHRRGVLPALHEVLRARAAAGDERGPARPAAPRRPAEPRSTSTGSAYRFPELKLTMMHGADPWWDMAIRLMIKYGNLRLMTSAWAPRHLPESLLHFMRTRGKNRIMFASDSPVLTITRDVKEASELDLPEDVLENYLYNNANEYFFGGMSDHERTHDRTRCAASSSSATPSRTSRGSRSTTRRARTRTTRRCAARCAPTSTSSPATTTSRS